MNNVSVIIPVYNTEKYLRQCVDSVLTQTMLPDEIILVDDGSTDESSSICDQYAKDNSIITAIHKKNEGLGFARNTGMSVATSKYIMFLDSDDFIKADMIETLFEASENGRYDLIKSGFTRVNLDGNRYHERSYESDYVFEGEEILSKLLPRMLGSDPDKHDSFEMGVTCSLMKRDIINRLQLQFPSEREYISEDLIFNMQLVPNINSAKVIRYNGYLYRTNPDSLTVRFREDRFESCKKMYRYVEKRIEEIPLQVNAKVRWDKTYLILLRMCIKQEKGNPFRDSWRRIHIICNDKLTKQIIVEYPVRKLEFKQKVFVALVKYRMALVLWSIHQ